MDSEDSTLENTSSRPVLREIHSNEVHPNSNLLSPSSKQSPNKFLQQQQRQQPPVGASLNSNSNFHGNSVAVGTGFNQLNVENTLNDADLEKSNTNPFMGLMTIDSCALPELPECLNPNFADHLRTPSRDSIVLAVANDLNSGLRLNETNKGDFEKIDFPKEPAEASSDNEIFDECQSHPFILPNSTEHTCEDAFSSALNSKNNTMTATQLEAADAEVVDADIDSLPLPPPPAQWENLPDSEQFSKLPADNLERNLNSNAIDEIVANVTFSNNSDSNLTINEYCTNITLESDVAFTEEQRHGDKLEMNVIAANYKEDSKLNNSQNSEQDVFNETFETICTDKSPEKELESLKEKLPSSNELTETLPTLRSFPIKMHTENVLFPQLTDECQKQNTEFLNKSKLNDCVQKENRNEVVSNEEVIAESVENVYPLANNQMDINELHIRNIETLFGEKKSDENLPVINEKISSHGDSNDPIDVANEISNEEHEDHEQNLDKTMPVTDTHHNLNETIDLNKETAMELSQNLNETIDIETDVSLSCEINRKSEVSDILPTIEQNKDTSFEHPQPNTTGLTSLNQSVAQLSMAVGDNIMNRTFASSSSNRNALNLEDFQFEEMVLKNNSELRAKNLNLSPKTTIKVNKQTIDICNTPATPKNSQNVEPMDVDEMESPVLPIGRQNISFSASSTSPTSLKQLLSAKEKSKSNLSDEKDVVVDQQSVKSPFDKETFQSQSLADIFAFPTSSSSLAEQQKITDEFTEEDFHSNRIFLNPSDFDFLLTKGNNNVHVDRSSLLLRFDPLLGHSVPVNIGNSSSNNESLSPTAGSTLTIITNNNNNNSNRLSPANEEDEFFINNTNKVFNLESKNKVRENQIISEKGAKLLDASRQKEKQNRTEQENNFKSPGKSVKKNAKMSVDVIQDLKIDNDCKSIENNHNSQSDEKQIFKMDELEKKIKNEVLKTEDIEKKLKEAEQREEALIKRITEKDKNIAKMNTVIEAYEKAIAELIAEKEQLIQKYQKELSEVKADRDSNYHHLTSLETTFSDLHVKYEKSKEMTAQLKTSEEELLAEKRKNLENLRLQEQRYEKMKNHAMQQLEIANKKLETFTRNHTMESTKLKALLKKEEISRASISEQLQQKSRENEELVKICDELINGQGS